MKLSKTQRAVLEVLAEDGVFLHYMPYMGSFNENAYYFPSSKSGMHVRTSTADALVKQGYAEQYNHKGLNNDHKVRITKAGREALAGGER